MAQVPHAEKGLTCPLWKKDVSQVCHKCPWYTYLRTENGNTGKEVDDWACAISVLPVLLVENAKQTRGAAAATEDARNNIVDAMETTMRVMVKIAEGPFLAPPTETRKLIPGN